MPKLSSISIIGAGNIAWHLAPALDNTDFAVREVYSRKAKHAAALVGRLYEAEVKDTLDFSSSQSGIFIICVPDDAIEEVVQEIVLPDDATLVHTSGSQPISVLEYAATYTTGVFYPLQTFSKEQKINFQDVPIFIESEDKATEKMLMNMGKAISKKVQKISSSERRALHIAAVFASNFTNHMITLASEIMKDNDLNFEWLKPLIAETINKSLTLGPSKSQTGPAKRGDLEILDKHLEFLKKDKAIARIYKEVTQHILDKYVN